MGLLSLTSEVDRMPPSRGGTWKQAQVSWYSRGNGIIGGPHTPHSIHVPRIRGSQDWGFSILDAVSMTVWHRGPVSPRGEDIVTISPARYMLLKHLSEYEVDK